MQHTIATFNMSMAGDLGLDPRRQHPAGTLDKTGKNISGQYFAYESEGSFHLSNETGDLRRYWKNALEVVKDFWKTEPNASVMGLQEMAKTSAGTLTGSGIVETEVKRINPKLTVVTEELDLGFFKTAVSLIWNTKKLGTDAKHTIADLDYVPTEATDTNPDGKLKTIRQTGRPILIAYTTLGYLLVALHGPNQEELSRKTFIDFRTTIQSLISTFVDELPEGLPKPVNDKIFIMGDLNDRYDALQTIELTLNGASFLLTYSGKAPLSCCHNWDSSCSDARYEILRGLPGRQDRTDIGTCKMPEDGRSYVLSGPGQRFVMGREGDINNYRYYGDKVFGGTPTSDIEIFRPEARVHQREDGGYFSQESDHEMVIATYLTRTGISGGRRSRRRRTRRYTRRR